MFRKGLGLLGKSYRAAKPGHWVKMAMEMGLGTGW